MVDGLQNRNLTFRIIPRLEIKNKNLVKGINLEGLRVIGDPIEFSKNYYEDGADEIFFQDIVASLYKRDSFVNIIKNLASNIFIPLTVGGGIKSINLIENILENGADKVSINSHAFYDKKFLSKAVKYFGSSTINSSIEVNKIDNTFFVFYNNGRSNPKIELLEWIKYVQDQGVGEISLISIRNEGTKKGIDEELIEYVLKAIKIPLLYNGGVASIEDILKLHNYGINGALISSYLHFHKSKKFQNLNKSINIIDLKKNLNDDGCKCRLDND